jgi:hypothetical protein
MVILKQSEKYFSKFFCKFTLLKIYSCEKNNLFSKSHQVYDIITLGEYVQFSLFKNIFLFLL